MKTRPLLPAIGIGFLGVGGILVIRTHHGEFQSSDPLPPTITASPSPEMPGKPRRIRRKRTAEEEFDRAQAYFKEAQLDAAREAAHSAVEKNPDEPKYRHLLVTLLNFQAAMDGKSHEILLHLHWLAASGHARPGDYSALCEYELRGVSRDSAVERLEELAKQYPAMENLEAYRLELWGAFYGQGSYERVESEAKAFLARHGSGSPTLHYVLACSLEKLGDTAGALEHFRVHYRPWEDSNQMGDLKKRIKKLEAQGAGGKR